VLGAGAGAGAAVAAVAVRAAWGLVPASWARAAATSRLRWVVYAGTGAAAAATVGQWLVVVLLACGAIELLVQRSAASIAPLLGAAPAVGGLSALAWVALKVGALSYGGGFVIIPLMQSDAVGHYHWMSGAQFLNAVALGQVTPGPVVQTVAVVGYAARGVGGALLAAVVAFTPSFAFILGGGGRFDRVRRDERARSFLDGAGPAAIGAILGAAIPLSRALHTDWQFAVLGAAAVALLALRGRVVATLLLAGCAGVGAALAGAPLPH